MVQRRKRRWRDRRDGRYLRSLNPMQKLMPYIMPQRCDALNYFRSTVDLEVPDRYVREKREAGLKNFTMMHVLLAAYVRLLSQRPALNRFVSGQKIYARNDIQIMLVVKKDMKLDSADSVITMVCEPHETAEQIYEKMEELIAEAKGKSQTNFDNLARTLDMIPGLFKRFVVWLLRTLDYFGLLPGRLTKLSPFHGTLFITSMASLGLPPIYHHIYNFGNVPVFLAFGIPQRQNELQKDGTIRNIKTMDYTLVMDERICDGFYFASAFRVFSGLLRDPWKMDVPPEEVVEDVD
ncbi:MAG: hypothetical protein U0L09_03950 [Christensenellales bacterium]|nr:hypothetical protein [Christensenellales bacterium]